MTINGGTISCRNCGVCCNNGGKLTIHDGTISVRKYYYDNIYASKCSNIRCNGAATVTVTGGNFRLSGGADNNERDEFNSFIDADTTSKVTIRIQDADMTDMRGRDKPYGIRMGNATTLYVSGNSKIAGSGGGIYYNNTSESGGQGEIYLSGSPSIGKMYAPGENLKMSGRGRKINLIFLFTQVQNMFLFQRQ